MIPYLGHGQTYFSGTTIKTAAPGFVVFEAWAFQLLASEDFCSYFPVQGSFWLSHT